MAYHWMPDLVLQQNIQSVKQNLVNMMDNDEQNFYQAYSNAQNRIRPILGRRSSEPVNPSYVRKTSIDSVCSDGLLLAKTTLLPTQRSSYFEEVRPRDVNKRFERKVFRRNSFQTDFSKSKRSLQDVNIYPKTCPAIMKKDLPQTLKILEDNLLYFLTLSGSLNANNSMVFTVIEKDTSVISGLNEYFLYLIKFAFSVETWISSIAHTLKLDDKFLDAYHTLKIELHNAILQAQKFVETIIQLEESEDLNESIEELTHCIRANYTFIWLTLRLSGYLCQVQERNLFIGVN
ncbi:hypothetical protein DMENIID0001_026110 [Sergentomyia squamirostris]